MPTNFLSSLTEEQPNKYLLFEGAVEGKGQLVLTIYKGTEKIGEYPPLYLDIKDIKRMYDRAKAQPNDKDAPVSGGYPKPFDYETDPPKPAVSFVADPNGQAFEKPWDETKQCIVFVHGLNVDYNSYQSAAQTMFKRLWHRGYKGRFCGFRWPTLTDLSKDYNESDYRAWKYGPALKAYVASLPSDYARNIAAHSQGNVLTGSALVAGMGMANYVLMQGAVPASCFDENAPTDSRVY